MSFCRGLGAPRREVGGSGSTLLDSLSRGSPQAPLVAFRLLREACFPPPSPPLSQRLMEYQAERKARLDGDRRIDRLTDPLAGGRCLPSRHGLLGNPHRQASLFSREPKRLEEGPILLAILASEL